MPEQSHGIPRLSVSVLQSQSWQSFSFSQQHLISLCACTYIIHTHLYTYMTSISRWRASLAAVQKAKQNSFSQHGRTQHCKCYQKKLKKKIYMYRERARVHLVLFPEFPLLFEAEILFILCSSKKFSSSQNTLQYNKRFVKKAADKLSCKSLSEYQKFEISNCYCLLMK